MILDRAEQLQKSAGKLRQRRDLANQRAAWDTHAKRFSALSDQLRGSVGFVGWFVGMAGTSVNVSPIESIPTALSGLQSLVGDLTTAPQDTLEGDRLFAVPQMVERALGELEKILAEAWSSYTDKVDWIPSNLWTAFRDQPDLRPLVQKAIGQDRDWEGLRRKLPLDSGAQEQFTKLLDERRLLLDKLPDVTDEEVRAFVVAAGSFGAVLSSLTDGVRAWLEQNGLMGAYLVVQNSK